MSVTVVNQAARSLRRSRGHVLRLLHRHPRLDADGAVAVHAEVEVDVVEVLLRNPSSLSALPQGSLESAGVELPFQL